MCSRLLFLLSLHPLETFVKLSPLNQFSVPSSCGVAHSRTSIDIVKFGNSMKSYLTVLVQMEDLDDL